ncbi:uncharacterized protein LOC132299037 [Cornus florida]|uniref:uncharacterized protein LOC132299037 n=1 Tax=Cornus florida TaxID=4283 RepID=UPI00289BCD54|nr:uncharacterized protein LOC132299037 [Cornus florida]
MAFEKRALDERNALLDTISRVNGGMLALHARFSRVGALRYAQGFREGYADRVPDEGQTVSTPDNVDKELDIDPPGVYTDPDSTAAEGIFDECQEIASSRITPTPPAALTLDIFPLSTLTPSTATAEDNPQQNDSSDAVEGRTQQNDSVIHLDSPPREDDDTTNNEEAAQHHQEADEANAS